MTHLEPTRRLPLVRELKEDLSASDIFIALEGLPGRLWLDSSTAHAESDVDDAVAGLSRYSFLSADPIATLVARASDPDPWPQLARWVGMLPDDRCADLPPFQGGLAGVLGYESSRWLRHLELGDSHRDQSDDLPTPALSIGCYDWTIAIDHRLRKSWLICQGLSEADLQSSGSSPEHRWAKAHERADQIESWLESRRSRVKTRMDSAEDIAVDSNFTGADFRAAVADIVDRIHRGDSFQVNLAQRLTAELQHDSAALYLTLRKVNPAPFSGFYDGGDFQVLSSSPEGFLAVRQNSVETRPIKGTVARTGDDTNDGRLAEQLLRSEKDRAENIMIVDLMRNDLSQVCVDESVVVKQLCQIERYQFVQHLVSVVQGRLREGSDVVDLLRACFPGGSVTGAPKPEAMMTIAKLEKNPRGPYCGSMGYIGCGGDSDFNILIRTMTAAHGKLQIPVGGGITARSNPESEEAETWTKAEGMLRALRRSRGPKRSDTSSTRKF